jgi:DNA-directed RNA polymerase subunit RPC12/RpoP
MSEPNHKGKIVQFPCSGCNKEWEATVGRRGWNRCRHCGSQHFAVDLLHWLDHQPTESTEGVK